MRFRCRPRISSIYDIVGAFLKQLPTVQEAHSKGDIVIVIDLTVMRRHNV